MNGYQPAHHPKLEVHSERDLVVARLIHQHYLRIAARFVARDPLGTLERCAAGHYLLHRRNVAKAWLKAAQLRAEEAEKLRRQKLKTSMRIIAGGLR